MNKSIICLSRSLTQHLSSSLNVITRSRINLHTAVVLRMVDQVDKTELKKRLTPIQYHVTQEKGTERPFSGCYNKTHDPGTYMCIVCEQPLFSSEAKYDSGCGWPAFNDVLDKGKVKLSPDTSGGQSGNNEWIFGHAVEDAGMVTSKLRVSPKNNCYCLKDCNYQTYSQMFNGYVGANLLLLISQPGRIRTEVTCSKCGAHLGHVFDDGPPPKRKRFCINSASLNFIPSEKTAGDG